MRLFSLGVTTLLHGFFALVWLLMFMDAGSPSFQLSLPDWTGVELLAWGAVAFATSAALGVVMHTISRRVFQRKKDTWGLEVLSSATVQQRFAGLGTVETFPGGPNYPDAIKAEGSDRLRKAGAFIHAVDHQLLARAPDVWHAIQVYRGQYRLARGFILTWSAFALLLPFWDPVRQLDRAGYFGPFPLIRSQLFMLSVLAAAVCYVSFRERAYRYAAAQLLAYATIEGERRKGGK
jgi:hypothetical protein